MTTHDTGGPRQPDDLVERLDDMAQDFDRARDSENNPDECALRDVGYNGGPLFARAAARIQEQAEEIARLRAMLPDIPRIESECKTLDNWRDRAMYLESQWSNCSGACARIQGRAERAEAEVARLQAWESRAVASMNDACTATGVKCCDEIPAAVERLTEQRDQADAWASNKEDWIARAEKAEAERDALRQDAERYRWLRREAYCWGNGRVSRDYQVESIAMWTKNELSDDAIAAAIDAAMKGKP